MQQGGGSWRLEHLSRYVFFLVGQWFEVEKKPKPSVQSRFL